MPRRALPQHSTPQTMPRRTALHHAKPCHSAQHGAAPRRARLWHSRDRDLNSRRPGRTRRTSRWRHWCTHAHTYAQRACMHTCAHACMHALQDGSEIGDVFFLHSPVSSIARCDSNFGDESSVAPGFDDADSDDVSGHWVSASLCECARACAHVCVHAQVRMRACGWGAG